MAQHQRQLGVRQLPIGYVEIGPADGAGVYAQQELPRTGYRLRELTPYERRPGALEHHGPHEPLLPSTPRGRHVPTVRPPHEPPLPLKLGHPQGLQQTRDRTKHPHDRRGRERLSPRDVPGHVQPEPEQDRHPDRDHIHPTEEGQEHG